MRAKRMWASAMTTAVARASPQMADKLLPQLQELTKEHVLRKKLAHDVQKCFTPLQNALQNQERPWRALVRHCLSQEVMAGVHQFEYVVTAPMQDSMLAADSAANKLLAEEAQEKAQATAKKGKKKKQTLKKLCQETKEQGGSHEVAHSSQRAASKQKLPEAVSFPAAASADVATGSDQEAVNHFLQDLFCCPLTQVTLVDPVIAADGYTYERTAVQCWLQNHETSPVTSAKLVHIRLVPNVIIKSAIAIQQLQFSRSSLSCS